MHFTKNVREYIQLKHENVMVVKGDKLIITLIPTMSKRKKSVIVKILRNNEQYDNRRLTYTEYEKIFELIVKTNQKELELPKNQNYTVGVLDGGSNSITLKKDSVEKKLYTHGISKEYHEKFYKVAEIILKAAKMEIRDIN